MSIVLIRPGFTPTGFDQQCQEPINLGYLAAVLRRDGFDVRILDAEFCDLDADTILDEVASENPEMVGLSIMSEGALPDALTIAEGIREWAAPGAHITAGGQFTTFYTNYLLHVAPAVDSAVLFEGEHVIVELARRVLGSDSWRDTPGLAFRCESDPARVCRSAKAPPIVDLDGLPFPARDLLPKAIQLGIMPAVLSSRGCSGRCSFCTIHQFMRDSSGHAWRARSPGNVVAEIKALADNFRIGEIGFLDDDFIGTPGRGRRRAEAIADRLIEADLDLVYSLECRPDMVQRDVFAKLRDAGLRWVFVGVEGVTPGAERVFNKGISRDVACRALDTLADLGLHADVGFILYHPDATMEEIWEGYQFLKAYGQCDVHAALNRLFVARGTLIRERLLRAGRLRNVGNDVSLGADDYDFVDPRVGVLLAILRVAVFPLFPPWYGAVKGLRRLRAERKFHPAAAQVDERIEQIGVFTTRVDQAVEHCFEEAYAWATGTHHPDMDMLRFSRQLLDHARAEVRTAAEATSCAPFLTAGEHREPAASS